MRIKGRTRAATHQRIVTAALVSFAEHGYAGASLARIAAASEVTPGALCQHFGDKAGLYRAAHDEAHRVLVDAARAREVAAMCGVGLPLTQVIEAIYSHAEACHIAVRFLSRRALDGVGAISGRTLAPLLEATANRIAEAYQVPPRRARDAVVALGHLIARFVTTTARDNARALGLESEAETRRRIVALLASTARELLATELRA